MHSGARFCSECGAPMSMSHEKVQIATIDEEDPFPVTMSTPAVPIIDASHTAIETDDRGMLRRIFSTQGRISRTGFWLFQLSAFPYFLFAGMIASLIDDLDNSDVVTFDGVMLIAFGIFLIPSWGAAIKRAHDLNRSGGFAALSIVPLLGFVITFLLLFERGTDGPNKYGMPNSGGVFRRDP